MVRSNLKTLDEVSSDNTEISTQRTLKGLLKEIDA